MEITPLALARVHDGALAAITLTPDQVARGADTLEGEAERFFEQVLAPIGNTSRPGRDRRRSRLLRSALHERSAELQKARADLDSEERRTQSLTAELETGTRERDEFRQTASRTVERLRQVTRQLLTAQEDERMRISRDLHDDLGQNLTAVKITLAGLQNAAVAEEKRFRRDIRRSQQLLVKAMKRVRNFAIELRPPLLDHLGLVPALRALTEAFARGRTFDAKFSTDTEELGLGGEVATAMYRVAQEALNNVRRHARATHVDVMIRKQPAAVEMEIRDDGRAFDPNRTRSNPKRGLGILCMKERMTLVGGTLEIHTSAGQGTRVLASLPCVEVEHA